MTKRLAFGYLLAILLMAVFVFGQSGPSMGINSLSPTHIAAGSSSFPLTVYAYWTSGCNPVINFGTTALSTTQVSATELNATVPASLVTTMGSYPITLTSSTCTTSNTVSFTVDAPPLTIATSSPLPTAVVGTPYSATFAVGTGVAPYNWSYNASPVPPGLSFTVGAVTNASLAGTPTTPGTYNFTMTVSDYADRPAPTTKNFTLQVVPQFQITTTSLPNGTIGVPYSQLISTTNGTSPYGWSVISGSLPAGLTLDTATGTIFGTPTTEQSSTFTLQATEGGGQHSQRTYTISIARPPQAITANNPSHIQAGSSSFPLTVYGNWASGCNPVINFGTTALSTTQVSATEVSATVPASLVTTMGSYPITLTSSTCNTSNTVSFTVDPPPLTIATSSPLPNAVVGIPYSATFSVGTGVAPYNWSYTATPVPPGLTFTVGAVTNASLAGTPTTPGTYTFTMTVSDYAARPAPTTKNFTLQVVPQFQITTTSIFNGTIGVPYSQAFSTANGTSPYGWSVISGSLPAGLTIDASTGTISGTPTTEQSSTFTLQATEGGGQHSQRTYTISIGHPALEITTDSLPPAQVGVAYSHIIPTSGGVQPIRFQVTGLPGGLTAASDGLITGKPTDKGTFTLSVQAQDSNGFVTNKAVSLLVNPAGAIFRITTTALPNGLVGTPYSTQLAAADGSTPYTWSGCGNIPGLSLSTAGLLAGTPNTVGDYTCSVTARDATGNSVTSTFPVRVSTGIIVSSPAALADATIGTAYTQDFTASGGQGPYTWSASGLPAGLALSSVGTLSGTPTAAGTFTVTVTATDSLGQHADKSYTLNVIGPLAITTDTVAGGFVGLPYAATLAASGGTPPYSWSAISSGGLSVNASGAISGTPTVAGPVRLNVTLSDAANRTVTKAITVNVAAGVTISTQTLPGGTVGTAYSATVQTSGGQSPYALKIAGGTIPTGLTFSSAGVLSGQPTAAGSFTFTVQADDANQLSTTRTYTVAIALPSTPKLTVASSLTNPGPTQQTNITVTTSGTFPVTITGRLVLTFAPDTVNGADDTSIQFASGGRVASFSVPAGSTSATFSIPTLGLQLGSTAGTITVTLDQVRANGQDITPTPAPVITIRIPRSGPTITSVTAARRADGFDVTISGFSASRDMTSAAFHFNPAAGQTLGTTDLTVQLSTLFAAWYNSAASAPYGSLFTMVMPFNTGGASTSIGSVSVTLTNSTGTSNTVTATLP